MPDFLTIVFAGIKREVRNDEATKEASEETSKEKFNNNDPSIREAAALAVQRPSLFKTSVTENFHSNPVSTSRALK